MGEMMCELLGAVDGAVLAAGAAEEDLEGGEMAFEVFLDALIDEGKSVEEETVDGGLVLEELDDGAVFACIGLVLRIATGVGQCAAIEDESAAVAGGVRWEAVFVTEAAHGDGEGVWDCWIVDWLIG